MVWAVFFLLKANRPHSLDSLTVQLLSDSVWSVFSGYFDLTWQIHFVEPPDFCILSCDLSLRYRRNQGKDRKKSILALLLLPQGGQRR